MIVTYDSYGHQSGDQFWRLYDGWNRNIFTWPNAGLRHSGFVWSNSAGSHILKSYLTVKYMNELFDWLAHRIMVILYTIPTSTSGTTYSFKNQNWSLMNSYTRNSNWHKISQIYCLKWLFEWILMIFSLKISIKALNRTFQSRKNLTMAFYIMDYQF